MESISLDCASCYNCNRKLQHLSKSDKYYFCQECSAVEYTNHSQVKTTILCSECYDETRVLKTFYCCPETGKIMKIIVNKN